MCGTVKLKTTTTTTTKTTVHFVKTTRYNHLQVDIMMVTSIFQMWLPSSCSSQSLFGDFAHHILGANESRK